MQNSMLYLCAFSLQNIWLIIAHFRGAAVKNCINWVLVGIFLSIINNGELA